jgi:UDP-glucose 4-epimerase
VTKSHTVRALLDLGEDCVAVQRRARELPAALAGARVEVEQADVTDRDALLAIGRRHDITGIVHPAGSVLQAPAPVVARMLGYHDNTTAQLAAEARGTLRHYAPGDRSR